MTKLSNKPLVSVIIPVFNGSCYLQEAVDSVLANSYKNIEILLIDDGSEDDSQDLCRELARQHKNINFYSFKQNRGLCRVLNYGLKRAKGNYICRLNQDDRMLKHRIATQVEYLESHPKVVVLGSSIKLFSEDGKTQIVNYLPTDQQIKKMWLIVSPFADPSVMYRKELAVKLGGYDQNFWPGDDTHLWIRMGVVGKLANLRKPLVEVRYHAKAASVKHWRRLNIITYKLHRWMHKEVQPAPLSIRVFWIGQLLAGFILTPDLNWQVYRLLKKIIHRLNLTFSGLSQKTIISKVSAVVTQPNI